MRATNLAAILTASALTLPACTASYSADLRNQTPQPVFAKILQRTDDGANPIQSQVRIGPGDRATIGPSRIPVGRALLTLDTMPNPQGPYTTDLRPGLTVFNIIQKGDATGGPLEVREISSIP